MLSCSPFSPFLLAILIASGTFLVPEVMQEPPPKTPPKAPPTVRPEAATQSVADILAQFSRQSGVLVLADTPAGLERIPALPANQTITAQNVEEHIARVVAALPESATWAKLYLPPPPNGRAWKGDDVAAYARAQAKLYGTVGGETPRGTTEILARPVPDTTAQGIIQTLDLRPVYIVTLGRGTFVGTWSSTFGEMRLRQNGNRVTGTYTSNDGEIQGSVKNGVLRFWWYERRTDGRGAGTLTLADDGQSFGGHWNSGDDPAQPGSEWTGKRLSSRP
jgi:hypothetical protein